MTRSLTVQSVLYGNDPHGIVRAAEATANAAMVARAESVLGDWSLALGDCSDVPVLTEAHLERINGYVEAAGGHFMHRVFGENLGHGGGHNRLVAESESDLLLFLNPDGQLGYDALAALVATIDGDVAVADARQVPMEHPKDYDSVTGDESWASGACMLTSRAVFEAVGGFDHETFFMYCDDVDYSWRVRLAGHRVVYQPAARVFHDKRLAVSGDMEASAAEVYYSAEAAVLLARKYSRDDIAERIVHDFVSGTDPVYHRVVQEVGLRAAEGRMPAPLDPEGRVAQFVGGNYARHRF